MSSINLVNVLGALQRLNGITFRLHKLLGVKMLPFLGCSCPLPLGGNQFSKIQGGNHLEPFKAASQSSTIPAFKW